MIIDSFTFFDELDVLDLRLNELDPHVDWFVLVEADTSFQGKPKPLHFEENRDRFEKFLPKIKYRKMHLTAGGAWGKELESRENLVAEICQLNIGKYDTIVYSDCDEIPSPEAIRLYNRFYRSQVNFGLMNLKQYTFYYNFNRLANYGRREFSRARIGTGDQLISLGREFRGGPRDLDHTFPSIENAGWHCGYFGSNLNRIRNKVDSFSHDDMAVVLHQVSDKNLAERITNGKDLFGREGMGEFTWFDDNDLRLPKYFLNNKEKFSMFTEKYFQDVHRNLLE